MVKRKTRAFEDIAVNSPWFLGIVFERTRAKVEKVTSMGPLAILKEVADDM